MSHDMIITEAMIIVLLTVALLLSPNEKVKKHMPHITLGVALLFSALNCLVVLCR